MWHAEQEPSRAQDIPEDYLAKVKEMHERHAQRPAHFMV